MVKRVAKHDIQLFRDGKDLIVKAGTEFDFTSQEVESINAVNKKALGKPPVKEPTEAEEKPAAESPTKTDSPVAKAESAKK